MSSSTTNLDLISASQAQKEVTANALFDAGSPATLFGRRASATAALTWRYYGGIVYVNSAPTSVANGTLTLTGSATNYVEYNPHAGTVVLNTSGWTAGYLRLYQIVTGPAAVTSYTDWREQGLGSLSITGTVGTGIGYLTGAGGTVGQLTSRTTGVTLNKLCGSIQTDTTSLAAATQATFTVSNDKVAIDDVITVCQRSGSNSGNTTVQVVAVAAGSFDIQVCNNNASGGTAETGAITINFAVIKSVTT